MSNANLPRSSVSKKPVKKTVLELRADRLKQRNLMSMSEIKTENVENQKKNDSVNNLKSKSISSPAEIQTITLNEIFNEQDNVTTEVDLPTITNSYENKMDAAVQVDLETYNSTKINVLLKTDEQLNIFTGIRSMNLLNSLVERMKKLKEEQGKSNYTLSHRDRIILTMMHVKLSFSYNCLSIFFAGVSPDTCKNTVIETFHDLSIILSSAIRWPSKERIMENMPKSFKEYQSTVGVLDCIEIKVEQVNCLKCKHLEYPCVEGCNTYKAMICITPSGLISYVSSAYDGQVSARQILSESQIVEKKTAPNRDILIVGEEFIDKEECVQDGVKLIRLPTSKNKILFDVGYHESSNVTAAREHIDKIIERIQEFEIFNRVVPLDSVSSIDYMLTTVCALVNLSLPIVGTDEFL